MAVFPTNPYFQTGFNGAAISRLGELPQLIDDATRGSKKPEGTEKPSQGPSNPLIKPTQSETQYIPDEIAAIQQSLNPNSTLGTLS